MNKAHTVITCALLCLLSGCNQKSAKTTEAPSIDNKNAQTVPVSPVTQETSTPQVASISTESPAPAEAMVSVEATPTYFELDTDGNGLYDDTERKELLEVFLREVPEMRDIISRQSLPVIKAASNYQEDFNLGEDGELNEEAITFTTFDTNGDGKVTILEQTQDRPPLSMLVPKRIIDVETRIPWAIDIFPEWISTAFLQENAPVGNIEEITAIGVYPREAVLVNPASKLRKTAEGAGVEFSAKSGAQVSTLGRKDARWDYRWCILTFRLDADSGSGPTTLLDVNRGDGPGMSTPKIWYDKATGLNIQYVGRNKDELDRRIMSTKNIVTDGEGWNVVVCGIRYGQMYASVNGIPLKTNEEQPPRYSTDRIEEGSTYIGSGNKDNVGWAYDAIILGLTEPSEAMVRKMTGWAAHRLNFEDRLPDGHPYKNERPYLDKEDFPDRFIHDDITWNDWGRGIKSEVTRVNAGGPRVEPQGFERVFMDDFRAKRITDSNSGDGDLWTGFGFNTAVGIDGPLIRPSEAPEAYSHDSFDRELTLSVIPTGDSRWRSAAVYSTNDLGYGYTWTGPKIFRIKCKFPKVSQEDLPKGLFPAFWSYGIESIFWRTANRIEIDYFEFEGTNGAWLNGLSTHYHYPYIKGENNIFAKNTDSYNRFKVYAGELNEPKSKLPNGGIFVWDGEYHIWEFVIEEDMTYVNVTMNNSRGDPEWVEVFRYKTAPTYLEELNLIINTALKGKSGKGYPKKREAQEYVIDGVEVLQKTSQIEEVPEPFTARPEIRVAGLPTAGSTVFCRANVEGVTDLRYFWFADGYPLTYGPSNQYTLTRDDVGRKIRCMVKAVGALDQPVAWSNYLE